MLNYKQTKFEAMKTTHTPGQWKVGAHTSPDKLGMKRATVETLLPSGNTMGICICSGCNGQEPGEEAKANAKLIAAAPELLEALIKANEYISRNMQTAYMQFGEEAIQKATQP